MSTINAKYPLDILDKVTIVVTRHYGNAYIFRLLDFYKLYDIPAKILILDSSIKPIDIDRHKGFFRNGKISYVKFDNEISRYKKLLQGLDRVSTPYIAVCADDDFITPQAIQECVYFLEQNPEYSCAHGLFCSHYLRKGKKEGIEFKWLPSQRRLASVLYDRPAERLSYYLSHYTSTTFYAVNRSDLMRLALDETVKNASDERFAEILSSVLRMIYGKLAILPIFYASREIVANSSGRISDPWNELLRRGDFRDRYDKVVNCLAEHLRKQERLDVGTSIKTAQESLDAYLTLAKRYAGDYTKKSDSALKKILKGILPHDLTLRLSEFRKKYLNSRYIKILSMKNTYSRLLEKENSKYYSDFQNVRKMAIKHRIGVSEN